MEVNLPNKEGFVYCTNGLFEMTFQRQIKSMIEVQEEQAGQEDVQQ